LLSNVGVDSVIHDEVADCEKADSEDDDCSITDSETSDNEVCVGEGVDSNLTSVAVAPSAKLASPRELLSTAGDTSGGGEGCVAFQYDPSLYRIQYPCSRKN
jgi:hypothetical protein